jgi:signal transduction histidine kinase
MMRERFALEIEKKQIDFRSASRVQSFMADPGLIQRALFNLLSNALRHVDIGGQVSLNVEADVDSVSLRVHNTGDEVSEDEVKKVFDRMYRGEYARSTPGSGLGLTIAKRIAELHGGSIQMESASERGVTVVITLPRAKSV